MKTVKICCCLIFAFLAFTASAQKKDCTFLKNCKLRYTENEDKTSFVTIEGENHTEYFQNKKYYIKSKLKWISDCEYQATMTKITLPDFPFKPGTTMRVKFYKFEKNMAYYVSTIKDQNVLGKFEILN